MLNNTLRRVRIVYCQPCGFWPQARALEKEIKSKYSDADIEVEEGDRGIFDVYVDDKLVFSRYEEEMRFPEPGEILRKME